MSAVMEATTMNVAVEAVGLHELSRWQPLPDTDASAASSPDADDDADTNEENDATPFVIRRDLNARIALWHGAAWKLQADAVANATNELLNDTQGACRRLLDAAGPEIWTECASAAPCRTGETVVTRGCRLPAHKILHTVGPRYNAKYHNAAEHALHMCYRSALSAAVELALRSVAFPCLYTKKKAYPRDEATHLALRTVRRFMENHPHAFDLVVLCVESLEDQLLYETHLPLYFPRNVTERQRSLSALASRDLGDRYGEPVIQERKIRIQTWMASSSGRSDGHHQGHGGEHEEEEDGDEGGALTDDEEEAIQSFCEMTPDPDAERLERLRCLQLAREQGRAHGPAVLGPVRGDRLDALAARRFFYNGGVDHSGAPVMIYMASRLCLEAMDEELALAFIQRAMHTIKDKPFSVLYVHDGSGDGGGGEANANPNANANATTAAWLKRVLRTFADQYERQLRFFYVLQPSMWLKLLLLVVRGFGSGSGRALYQKLVYLSSTQALANVATTLDLPPHIYPQKPAPVPHHHGSKPPTAAAAV